MESIYHSLEKLRTRIVPKLQLTHFRLRVGNSI